MDNCILQRNRSSKKAGIIKKRIPVRESRRKTNIGNSYGLQDMENEHP